MVLPLAFFVGVIFGVYKAKRSNGRRFDVLHYAGIYGIFAVLLALIFSIVLQRLGFFV